MFEILLTRIAAGLGKVGIPYMIHKCFAGRPRDLEHTRSIIIKNPDFDRAYVRHWFKELEILPDRADLSRAFENLPTSLLNNAF